MSIKYTTGIDVVNVERFKDILGDEHFKERVFSKEELIYIFKSDNVDMQLNRISARFAAKEAFYKSVPNLKELIMKEVTVSHDNDGRPFFSFFGKTKEFVEKNKLIFDLSISHDAGLAIATVVCSQTA